MAERLDKLLVSRGLFETRSQAQAAIAAGLVSVDGQVVSRASEKVMATASLSARAANLHVSRAGGKLAHALTVFDVKVAGKTTLDLGASTGGFTDVLLSHGAARVIAIDVGRDQFHPRLRSDPRVQLHEQLDARNVSPAHTPHPPEIIVSDLSFIGLEKALGPALDLAAATADLVALFKPQFQVGPAHVGKGGLVRDAAAIDTARSAFAEWLRQNGWTVQGWAQSPITGKGGNREWLVHARRSAVDH